MVYLRLFSLVTHAVLSYPSEFLSLLFDLVFPTSINAAGFFAASRLTFLPASNGLNYLLLLLGFAALLALGSKGFVTNRKESNVTRYAPHSNPIFP